MISSLCDYSVRGSKAAQFAPRCPLVFPMEDGRDHRLANNHVVQLRISGNLSDLINNCGLDLSCRQRRILASLTAAFDGPDTGVVAINDRVAFGHVVDHCHIAVRAAN